jgi:hypothetical protein
MWEMEQQKHQKKLAAVARAAPLIDQREPMTHVNNSLLRGRERSKAYIEHMKQQHTDKGNRRLLGALGDISKKQSIVLKRVETEPWVLPPLTCTSSKAADRRRKQKALAMENEQLVKRLLAIRTTFDRKTEEKQFLRHKKAVEDMRKVPPPQAVAHREKKRTVRLPKLTGAEVGELSDTSGTEADSPQREALVHSRSMPALPSQGHRKKKVHIVEARENRQGLESFDELHDS